MRKLVATPGTLYPREWIPVPTVPEVWLACGRYGWDRKIRLHRGFEHRTDQPAASRYSDWAIPVAGNLNYTIHKFLLYVRSSIQSHTTVSRSTNLVRHLTYRSTRNQSNNQFYFQEQRLDFVLRTPYLLSHNPIKEESRSCRPLAFSTTAPARRMWISLFPYSTSFHICCK